MPNKRQGRFQVWYDKSSLVHLFTYDEKLQDGNDYKSWEYHGDIKNQTHVEEIRGRLIEGMNARAVKIGAINAE